MKPSKRTDKRNHSFLNETSKAADQRSCIHLYTNGKSLEIKRFTNLEEENNVQHFLNVTGDIKTLPK